MSSPVTRFQIISKEPDVTAAFYANLFGWKISGQNALGYRQVETGSPEGIQGGIWPAPPQAQSFAQLFISVDDVQVAIQKAAGLGAKLLIPPTRLPDGEELAVMFDPLGMPFGIWRRGQPRA